MSNKDIKLDTVPLLRSVVYSHQENCSVVTTRKKCGEEENSLMENYIMCR